MEIRFRNSTIISTIISTMPAEWTCHSACEYPPQNSPSPLPLATMPTKKEIVKLNSGGGLLFTGAFFRQSIFIAWDTEFLPPRGWSRQRTVCSVQRDQVHVGKPQVHDVIYGLLDRKGRPFSSGNNPCISWHEFWILRRQMFRLFHETSYILNLFNIEVLFVFLSEFCYL